MSVLLELIGRVEAIYQDTAHVTLWNPATKERFEATVTPEELFRRGLAVGDEFRVRLQADKEFWVEITKLAPKPLSAEDCAEIDHETEWPSSW